MADQINDIKYSSVQWYKNGVFYVKYSNLKREDSKKHLIWVKGLYYHKIGTPNKSDRLIYEPKDSTETLDYDVTNRESYLIMYKKKVVEKTAYKEINIAKINDSLKFNFKPLILRKKIAGKYFSIIGEYKNKILVQSNYNEENGALFLYNPNELNQGEIFVDQFKQRLTESFLAGNKVVSFYQTDVDYAVVRDSLGKIVYRLATSNNNSIEILNESSEDSLLYYQINSFYCPPSVYKLNLNSLRDTALNKTEILYDHTLFKTEKVYYYSKDSTLIPMYITHLKTTELNGHNPTILYGYGGFGISMEPFFHPANILFMKNGGIFAVPCIRGGGDQANWHEMGMRLKKENTFNDFIAAAEYLVQKKYTNSSLIAAMGGSNGGLTVCASMLKKPELFKLVICEAGVLDMVRYHLRNIGEVYDSEYGNVKDSADFINLINYSPVHNIKKGVEYPSTLLTIGDNDERVNPFETYKFLAALQNNGLNSNSYILFNVKKSGHNGNGTYQTFINRTTFVYYYIIKTLGMEKKFNYNLN